MTTESKRVRYDDEVDIRVLIRGLWSKKWLIIAVASVATAAAVVVALWLPDIYRAEALLAPNQEESGGSLARLAAQFGGLGTFAGIDLGSTSGDKTALGLEVLKSRHFIAGFIERHDLLVPLLAARGWEYETNALKIDADVYDSERQMWVRDAKPPRKKVPSLQEAYEEFRDLFSIKQDRETGFVVVAVEHYSPFVAKQWVDWLVEDLNATIMEQDVAKAEQAIKYLREQIEATALSELRNVFFRLVEEQTKTIMLAKVSDEYLFRTIDPAVLPEKKFNPKRALIVLFGLITGVFLGIFISLALHFRVAGE